MKCLNPFQVVENVQGSVEMLTADIGESLYDVSIKMEGYIAHKSQVLMQEKHIEWTYEVAQKLRPRKAFSFRRTSKWDFNMSYGKYRM